MLIDEALKLKVPQRILHELKKFYDDGICDPEQLIITANEHNELTLQKRVINENLANESIPQHHQLQDKENG